MSTDKTGGPAFPGLDYINQHGKKNPEGMTLLDYFAAKAMQGMLSDANAIDEDTGKKLSIPDNAELIASAAYMMADAMLKERDQ